MRSKAFSWPARVTAGHAESLGQGAASSAQSWASGAPTGPMTLSQSSSCMTLSSWWPASEPRRAKALAILSLHPPPRTAAWRADSRGPMAGPSRCATWDPKCLLLTIGSCSGRMPPARYAVTPFARRESAAAPSSAPDATVVFAGAPPASSARPGP
eukprot:6052938-Lingulodinium_polyedra.AAC.1